MFAAGKAASGAEPTDAQFNYVTMLLHGNGTNGSQNNTFVDSSTNNFSITRNGNTTQGTFTPYGSNWSNNFVRASTQYLTVSNSGSQFTFGTGAFTIECWVNLASMPSGTGYPASYWLFGGGPVNSNPGIDFYINNTQIGFNLTDFTSPTAIGNHGMLVGVWYHVAVVRGGGSNQTVSIYVNGTRVATASSVTATADAATTGISISAAEPSGATSGNFDGYISNYRVVKGTAVYDPTQSTLTVPTTPLTAVTNTSLLTCQANRFFDASANALTITVNGSPSVQRFSPFSPTTAYSTSVIGGSGYFNGSSNLSVADNAAFQLGSGAFTIECWFYKTASGNAAAISKWNAGGSDSDAAWDLDFESGNIRGIVASGASVTSITSTEPALNTWNHAAFVRSGNTLSLFVNGSRVGTTTFSGSVNNGTQGVLVGQIAPSSFGGYIFTGYISNARVVKGTAVYDPTVSTLTVPTAPLTAITNTSLLLNYTNAGILDNAMMNDLETVGNAQISTSVKKYGTGSMYFDGTGDNLSGPTTPDLNMGTGNWTIECWVYISSRTLNYPLIFGNNNGGYTAGALSLVNSNADSGASIDRFCLSVKDISNSPTLVASSTNSSNTWYHLAVVRNGTSLVMYRDGTSVASTTISSGIVFDWGKLGSRIGGGNWDGAQSYFNGYIDDLRITKGVARYTSNFSVPTAAFPDKG